MVGGGFYEKNDELYGVLEIWDRNTVRKNIKAENIIGHSLGCNWALLNWRNNKNSNLILINPLLPKRKIYYWFRRWKKFHEEEKIPENKEIVTGFVNWIFGIRECLRLLCFDFDDIIDEIPKDKIAVIHGEKDIFYCDEKFKKYIKSKKIKTIEVKDAGHDWNEKFDEEIEKIIMSS